MKHLPLLLLGLLTITLANAQDNNLFQSQYQLTRFRRHDTTARIHQWETRFRIPLLQRDSNKLFTAVSYRYINWQQLPSSFGSSAHGIMWQLGWLHQLSHNKSLLVFVQSGLFSDMKDISGKDYRLGLGVRYHVKHSPTLSTGWGITYARQFFGNQIVPFIDVDYRPNRHWQVSGPFPMKPKIKYHVNNRLAAGIQVSGEASSYRLSVATGHRFVQINQWTSLAVLEYRLGKHWQVQAGAGMPLKQHLRLYNDANTTPWTLITIPLGKKVAPVYDISSRGLALQAGIAWSLGKE